jgi:hypothetical protein
MVQFHSQGVEHAPNFIGYFLSVGQISRRKKSEPLPYLKMSLEFLQRSIRHKEETKKFLLVPASKALGDVGRNGDRGTADLRGKPILFVQWQPLRKLITFDDQVHGLLPDHGILVALDLSLLFIGSQLRPPAF